MMKSPFLVMMTKFRENVGKIFSSEDPYADVAHIDAKEQIEFSRLQSEAVAASVTTQEREKSSEEYKKTRAMPKAYKDHLTEFNENDPMLKYAKFIQEWADETPQAPVVLSKSEIRNKKTIGNSCSKYLPR